MERMLPMSASPQVPVVLVEKPDVSTKVRPMPILVPTIVPTTVPIFMPLSPRGLLDTDCANQGNGCHQQKTPCEFHL
jgi:hypothetical protein